MQKNKIRFLSIKFQLHSLTQKSLRPWPLSQPHISPFLFCCSHRHTTTTTYLVLIMCQHSPKNFICARLILKITPLDRNYCHLHFTGEETEEQWGYITCPRSVVINSRTKTYLTPESWIPKPDTVTTLINLLMLLKINMFNHNSVPPDILLPLYGIPLLLSPSVANSYSFLKIQVELYHSWDMFPDSPGLVRCLSSGLP